MKRFDSAQAFRARMAAKKHARAASMERAKELAKEADRRKASPSASFPEMVAMLAALGVAEVRR